jgi:hypothetical protein
MSRLRVTAVWIFVVAACAAFGCQKSPYETSPVHGKVTIDGRPFTQGKVMFAPIAKAGSINSGKPAFGPLSSDGSYTLSTYGKDDGAVVGEHWVTLIRSQDSHTSASESTQAIFKFERVTVPEKKSVAAGQDNEIDIAITAKDIARYGSRSDD